MKIPTYQNPDLKKLYESGERINDIAKRLGWTPVKTAAAIQRGIDNGAIIMRSRAKKWTPELDAVLREKYGKVSNAEIAKALGSTERAIRSRANKIGLFTDRRVWTSDDTQWLKDACADKSPSELAQESGWSQKQIYRMLKEHGLSLPVTTIRKPAKAKKEKAVPRYSPAVESDIIPETARPWQTRVFGECVYPYGERGAVMSCCAPTWRGTSYCEAHAALCGGYRVAA